MLFFFLFGFYVIQNYLCDEYTRSETNQPADIYCFFPNLCVVVTKSNFKYLKKKNLLKIVCVFRTRFVSLLILIILI